MYMFNIYEIMDFGSLLRKTAAMKTRILDINEGIKKATM